MEYTDDETATAAAYDYYNYDYDSSSRLLLLLLLLLHEYSIHCLWCCHNASNVEQHQVTVKSSE